MFTSLEVKNIANYDNYFKQDGGLTGVSVKKHKFCHRIVDRIMLIFDQNKDLI